MGWDPGSWGPEVPAPPGGPPPRAVGDRGPPPGTPPAPRTRPETPPGAGGFRAGHPGAAGPPRGGQKTPKKGGFLPPPGGVQKRGKMPPKKRELIVRLFGRGFCTFRGGCNFGGFFAPQKSGISRHPPRGRAPWRGAPPLPRPPPPP